MMDFLRLPEMFFLCLGSGYMVVFTDINFSNDTKYYGSGENLLVNKYD
jgi:hypothetical protein